MKVPPAKENKPGVQDGRIARPEHKTPVSQRLQELKAQSIWESIQIDKPFNPSNQWIEEGAYEVLSNIQPQIHVSILDSGNFRAQKLNPNNEDYIRVQTYFENSVTKGYYQKRTIKNILEIERFADSQPNGLEIHPKMMLFHGTLEQNVGSILNEGFKLQPGRCREFYFADRAELSLQYAHGTYDYTSRKMSGGFLFLCEVSLGSSRSFPRSFVIKPGVSGPDPKQNVTVNGCVWPMGKTVALKSRRFMGDGRRMYWVYKSNQIRVKYLIQLE